MNRQDAKVAKKELVFCVSCLECSRRQLHFYHEKLSTKYQTRFLLASSAPWRFDLFPQFSKIAN